MQDLQNAFPDDVVIKQLDVSDFPAAAERFADLAKTMGGVDLVVICAGIGHMNPDLQPDLELQTVQTNVGGFVVLAGAAFREFSSQGSGHLVGISSIAALRGGAAAPAYNASKAFMSNYLEGLRVRARKRNLDIAVTDVRPGFVDTAMAQADGLFWVSSPHKAAEQIAKAIGRRQSRVYVTKRWRLVAWALRLMPDWLYRRI